MRGVVVPTSASLPAYTNSVARRRHARRDLLEFSLGKLKLTLWVCRKLGRRSSVRAVATTRRRLFSTRRFRCSEYAGRSNVDSSGYSRPGMTETTARLIVENRLQNVATAFQGYAEALHARIHAALRRGAAFQKSPNVRTEHNFG